MKEVLHNLLLISFILNINNVEAQMQKNNNFHLLRIYEDNDFLNIRGKGTDKAYTNGMRLDLFYSKQKPSGNIVDNWMPKAGKNSINVYGWSLMQVMFTPNDISKTNYQANDYSYCGALFATHSLYSYNSEKKYDLQTELVFGLRGPSSFAAQTQRFVHRMINYQRPNGWDNQMKEQLLLNFNFTAEKLLKQYRDKIEVIGAGKLSYGTQMNGASAYTLIRIGSLHPYFDGVINQFAASTKKTKRTSRVRAYVIIKPQVQLVLSNALLEDNSYTPVTRNGNDKTIEYKTPHDLKNLVYSVDYGAVLSVGNFSMSFIQNSSTALLKNTYNHEVGNISLYFSW